MHPKPVIAIFDIGKTNKKLLLFDEQYNVVWERSARLNEAVDEDGMESESLPLLKAWMFDSFREVLQLRSFEIRAINFAAYGASIVYIDKDGKPLTPLYNYLKPYPSQLAEQFYQAYGGQMAFAAATASPALGSLNSGLQLYRVKFEQPEVYRETHFALHLPQYLSYLFTGVACTDITSIGCHTGLWHFSENGYHHWVRAEGWAAKLAPIMACDTSLPMTEGQNMVKVGIGLHDSSAALIPYLTNAPAPFLLLSTGTWCITLNPFNRQPLTHHELDQDCLCYLTYQGVQVKASRLFAGHEHEQQTARIAAFFDTDPFFWQTISFDASCYAALAAAFSDNEEGIRHGLKSSGYANRDLQVFQSPSEAYHQLILDMVQQQFAATMLVSEGGVEKRLYVDGGFSKNEVYMHALAGAFAGWEVYAAAMPQATALGTALVLHQQWNTSEYPANFIQLKRYCAPAPISYS